MTVKMILRSLLAVFVINFGVSVYADTPTYTEDKTSIVADVKQLTFIIKLKSNPTTGYSWFLREYDADLITPVKHEFQQPEKKLIGAPGFELWTFRMKHAAFTVPQQTALRFVYARPWQGADNSTQVVFRVTTH